METVRRGLSYTWDGTADGGTDEVTVYAGKTARCRECHRKVNKHIRGIENE